MRYRLRTLIVIVTLIGSGLGWIAWQKRVVDNRQECARRLVETGVGIVVSKGAEVSYNYDVVGEGEKSRRICVIRRWLGDEDAEAVLFFDDARIDKSALELFPEANVWMSK